MIKGIFYDYQFYLLHFLNFPDLEAFLLSYDTQNLTHKKIKNSKKDDNDEHP